MSNHDATEAGLLDTLSRVQEIRIGHGYVHKEPNWKFFPGWRWREAITAYLNARWTDDLECRDIVFETDNGLALTLRFEGVGSGGRYLVFGWASWAPAFPGWISGVSGDCASLDTQCEIEQALIRFVRNSAVNTAFLHSSRWGRDPERKLFSKLGLVKKPDERALLLLACENIPENIVYF